MHRTTIQFTDDLWMMCREEAQANGIPVAQYIREAVIARCFYELGRQAHKRYGGALTKAKLK